MAVMADYTATAERDGKFWVITVDGVGVTQALSVTEAQEMASGLVYAMTDVEGAEVDIAFKGGALDGVEAVRRKQELVEQLNAEASEEMRRLVVAMDREGLKQAEIAVVLKVSRQRVGQLIDAKDKPAKAKGKVKVARRAKTRRTKRTPRTRTRSRVDA